MKTRLNLSHKRFKKKKTIEKKKKQTNKLDRKHCKEEHQKSKPARSKWMRFISRGRE